MQFDTAQNALPNAALAALDLLTKQFSKAAPVPDPQQIWNPQPSAATPTFMSQPSFPDLSEQGARLARETLMLFGGADFGLPAPTGSHSANFTATGSQSMRSGANFDYPHMQAIAGAAPAASHNNPSGFLFSTLESPSYDSGPGQALPASRPQFRTGQVTAWQGRSLLTPSQQAAESLRGYEGPRDWHGRPIGPATQSPRAGTGSSPRFAHALPMGNGTYGDGARHRVHADPRSCDWDGRSMPTGPVSRPPDAAKPVGSDEKATALAALALQERAMNGNARPPPSRRKQTSRRNANGQPAGPLPSPPALHDDPGVSDELGPDMAVPRAPSRIRDASAAAKAQKMFSLVPLEDLRVGMKVRLKQVAIGVIRFIGALHHKPGVWIGVELVRVLNGQLSGKYDGSIEGKRYFSCEPDRGLFLQASALEVMRDAHAAAAPAVQPISVSATRHPVPKWAVSSLSSAPSPSVTLEPNSEAAQLGALPEAADFTVAPELFRTSTVGVPVVRASGPVALSWAARVAPAVSKHSDPEVQAVIDAIIAAVEREKARAVLPPSARIATTVRDAGGAAQRIQVTLEVDRCFKDAKRSLGCRLGIIVARQQRRYRYEARQGDGRTLRLGGGRFTFDVVVVCR